MRVKLRRSAGSGKLVTIVEGRSSSVKSYGGTPQSKSQASADENKAYLSVPGSVRRLSWASSLRPPPRSSSCSISVSRRYVRPLSDIKYENMEPALIMACDEYIIEDVSQGRSRCCKRVSAYPVHFYSLHKPYSKRAAITHFGFARDHSSFSQMLPIIDLDIYRSQPLDSPAVVAECTKVSV